MVKPKHQVNKEAAAIEELSQPSKTYTAIQSIWVQCAVLTLT